MLDMWLVLPIKAINIQQYILIEKSCRKFMISEKSSQKFVASVSNEG